MTHFLSATPPLAAPVQEKKAASLIRIILINSPYRTGSIDYVPLEGGTALTGENGTGKTTTIKLQGIFNGSHLSTAARKEGGGQDSFVDRYLPAMDSYVLFEYRRENGGLRLAGLRRNTRNEPSYFFVNSAFGENLFTEENEQGVMQFVRSDQILNHIRALLGSNAAVKTVSSTKEYQRVITGNFTRNEKNLAALAQDFSLISARGGRDNRLMLDYRRIPEVMLSRKLETDVLFDLLVSMSRDDHHAETKEGDVGVVGINLDGQTIEGWIEDTKALRKVAAHHKDYKRALVCAEQEQALAHDFSRLAQQSQSALVHFKQQTHQFEQRIISHTAAARAEETEMLSALSVKRSQHDTLVSLCNQHKGDIDSLTQRKTLYDAEKTEEKSRELLGLPNHRQALEQEERRYERLTGDFKELSAKHEREKIRISQERQAAERQIDIDFNACRDRGDEDKEAAQHAYEQTQRRIDGDSIYDLSELFGKVSAAAQTLGQLNAQKAHPEPDNELVQAKAQREKELAAYKEHEVAAVATVQQAELAVSAAALELSKEERNHDQLTQKERAINATLVDLNARLSPNVGSVCHYLVENESEYAAYRMGQVLREDLFLSPTHAVTEVMGAFDDQAGVFGLLFDQKHLPKSHWDPKEKESIRLQIEEAEGEREQTVRALSASKSRAATLRAEQRKAQETVISAQIALKQKVHDREQARYALTQAQQAVQDNITQIKSTIEQRIERVTAQQHADNAEIAARKQSKQEALRLAKQHLATTQQAIQSTLAQARAAQKAAMVEQAQRAAERIKELEAEYQQSLETQGLDQAAIASSEKRIVVLERDIARISAYREAVENYQAFMGQWRVRLPELEASLASSQQQGDAMWRAMENLKAQHDQYREDQALILEQLRVSLKKVESERASLTQLTEHIAPYLPDGSVVLTVTYDPLWQAAYLQREFTELEAQYKTAHSERTQLCGAIERSFRSVNHLSSVSEYFHTLAPLEREDTMQWIHEWFKEGGRHKGHVDLIQLGRTKTSEEIAAAISELELFDKDLGKCNQLLQKNLNSNLSFHVVQDIEFNVRCKSSIKDWVAMGRRLRPLWNEKGEDGLPSEACLDALRNFYAKTDKGRVHIRLANAIEVSGSIVDNGLLKTFRNLKEFTAIGSNGSSYLVLIVLLIALTNGLRGESRAILHWPLDELADISHNNRERLIEILKNNDIELFSATPNTDTLMYSVYKNVIEISPQGVVQLDSLQNYFDYGGLFESNEFVESIDTNKESRHDH